MELAAHDLPELQAASLAADEELRLRSDEELLQESARAEELHAQTVSRLQALVQKVSQGFSSPLTQKRQGGRTGQAPAAPTSPSPPPAAAPRQPPGMASPQRLWRSSLSFRVFSSAPSPKLAHSLSSPFARFGSRASSSMLRMVTLPSHQEEEEEEEDGDGQAQDANSQGSPEPLRAFGTVGQSVESSSESGEEPDALAPAEADAPVSPGGLSGELPAAASAGPNALSRAAATHPRVSLIGSSSQPLPERSHKRPQPRQPKAGDGKRAEQTEGEELALGTSPRDHAGALFRDDSGHHGGSGVAARRRQARRILASPSIAARRALQRGATLLGSLATPFGGNFGHPTTPDLSVFVVTWNLGGRDVVLDELPHWLPHDDYDVIVIGLQECRIFKSAALPLPFSRPRSQGNRNSKSYHSVDLAILAHYGLGYTMVAAQVLAGMRLLVLCRASLQRHVSDVSGMYKATGVGGVLGNKGGLLVKLTVRETELCFIACHLAAHESEEKVARRNQDLQDILRAASNSDSSKLDIAQRAHHTILLGDLNYRVERKGGDAESEREEVRHLAEWGEFEALHKRDQLRRVMGENVLCGFCEDPPMFEPSYKVIREKGVRYSPQRMPSYCDRVLRTSLAGLERNITQLKYASATEVSSSDHKPVFAVFRISHHRARNAGSPSNSPTPKRRRSGRSDSLPSALSPSLGRLRSIGASKALHLSLTSVRVPRPNDEMVAAKSVVLYVEGPVVQLEQVVALRAPPSREPGAAAVFEAPAVTVPVRFRPGVVPNVFLSLWEGGKDGKLLSQCTLSLDGLAKDEERQFARPLLRYATCCGELRGVVALTTGHRTSSFLFGRVASRRTSQQ